jgi:hypothetical protein
VLITPSQLSPIDEVKSTFNTPDQIKDTDKLDEPAIPLEEE